MSLPEVLLWQILRSRPQGLKFRRQHPIGPYVLDFYCLERRMAVEVDGIVHEMGDGPKRDEARDAWLSGRNVTVLRLAARDILADPSEAAQSIVEQLRRL